MDPHEDDDSGIREVLDSEDDEDYDEATMESSDLEAQDEGYIDLQSFHFLIHLFPLSVYFIFIDASNPEDLRDDSACTFELHKGCKTMSTCICSCLGGIVVSNYI